MTTGLVPTLPAMNSDVSRSSGMDASRIRMWTAVENREFIEQNFPLLAATERNIYSFDSVTMFVSLQDGENPEIATTCAAKGHGSCQRMI